MCYTQCLWKKLRSELLQIGLIEELFQIRNNVFRLFKPAVIWYAPLLLSVAVLSWLLPVAMIYPPGALGVDITVSTRVDAMCESHPNSELLGSSTVKFLGNSTFLSCHEDQLSIRLLRGTAITPAPDMDE
jgi:hypothetical protein